MDFVDDAINDIIKINTNIYELWGNGGWAPPDAAEVLRQSRLDWQVSLSKTLLKWIKTPPEDEHDASLILAWANLGALVEGTMKWFLCVFYDDYSRNPVKRKDKMREPGDLFFHALTEFFEKTVWIERQKNQWKPFVDLVRERRNAIHAYQSRSIGDFDEFRDAVMTYRSFLIDHDKQVPCPENQNPYPDCL
jgi:hypothetical protein